MAVRQQRGTAFCWLACERHEACFFQYIPATSLEHALSLKAEYGDDAKFLAGGQSLIPTMNFRLARPAILIDINRIDGLGAIRHRDGGARVGAMTRYRTLERDTGFAGMFPLIADALPHIAHPQIRNRGTIGGNLSHADPASELPAIAVALGARFHLRSAKQQRWCDAPDFFVGGLTTDLQSDEMLVEVEFPPPKPRTGSCFMEIARRRGDFAIVGVATTMTLDQRDQCIVSGWSFAAWAKRPSTPVRAPKILNGHAPTEATIRDVAAVAQTMLDPSGSVHATADYQRHIAGVLTERALQTAYQRACHGR